MANGSSRPPGPRRGRTPRRQPGRGRRRRSPACMSPARRSSPAGSPTTTWRRWAGAERAAGLLADPPLHRPVPPLPRARRVAGPGRGDATASAERHARRRLGGPGRGPGVDPRARPRPLALAGAGAGAPRSCGDRSSGVMRGEVAGSASGAGARGEGQVVVGEERVLLGEIGSMSFQTGPSGQVPAHASGSRQRSGPAGTASWIHTRRPPGGSAVRAWPAALRACGGAGTAPRSSPAARSTITRDHLQASGPGASRGSRGAPGWHGRGVGGGCQRERSPWATTTATRGFGGTILPTQNGHLERAVFWARRPSPT